jgi:gliding motility-associated lipoprotein GldH
MKTKGLLILGVLLLLTACETSSIFNKKVDFTKNQWPKSTTNAFVFEVTDDSKNYDVTFLLRHVFDYQFDSIPLSFTWIKPDGSQEIIPISLAIKDKNGKELGECAGDICDLKKAILSNIKLPKGTNEIIVQHSFNYAYLPNIIQIGLDVSNTN